MHGPSLAAPLLGLLGALSGLSCSLDPETPAPIAEPPRVAGPCGTTENLLQGLFALSREGGLDDLRTIITEHSTPGRDGLEPDLALRNVLGAALRIITRLGIRATREAAISLGKGPVAESLSSIFEELLRLLDGQHDGRPRYDATKAMGFYLRRCDAVYMLTLAERGLRLERPGASGQPERWLAALLRESAALMKDPLFDQFLREFEESGEQGRGAVVGLLNQVLGFLADRDFEIGRVRALLESSVYPLVEPPLAARLDRFFSLFEEAVALDPMVQSSLQAVAACSLVDETARRDLLGLVYDVAASEALSLPDLLEEASRLVGEEADVAFLDHLAGLFSAVRDEREARQDIFVLLAVLLEPPDVERALPLVIELLRRDLVSELMFGVTTLLSGCDVSGGG